MAAPDLSNRRDIPIRRNPWADNFFRPAAIIVMVMCLNYSVVNFVRLVNPAWSGRAFLLAMLLTTVEAAYSHRMLSRLDWRGSQLRYRLVEIGLLALLVRLLLWAGKPLPQIQAELQTVAADAAALFTVEYYVVLMLAFLAWGAATFTLLELDSLYDPYIDQREALDSLAGRFFWGGAILMVISGVTQLVMESGAAALIDFSRPSSGGILLNVLLYFVLGLVLLSQINLTRLQVRWRIQKTPVAPGLVKQWARYGLIFLALLALAAFVLPTRYSLGLLASAGLAVQFLIRIIFFVVQLLILLVTLPIALLLSWLGVAVPPALNGGMPPAPPAPPPIAPGATPPWLEILQSILFWGVALAAVGYLIKSYFDDRPEMLGQLKQLRPLRWLAGVLGGLWDLLRGWFDAGLAVVAGSAALSAPLQKLSERAAGGNWFNLRRQSPRQKILTYYLNILRRAEKRGAHRDPAETPFEYEPHLAHTAPDAEPDIHQLTDTFVHARYSRQEFTEADAGLVRRQWNKIRQALRRRF